MLTVHDLTLPELRAVYRQLGGDDDCFDPDQLRIRICARSCGVVPPHTPNTSGRSSAHDRHSG